MKKSNSYISYNQYSKTHSRYVHLTNIITTVWYLLCHHLDIYLDVGPQQQLLQHREISIKLFIILHCFMRFRKITLNKWCYGY